MNCGPAAELEIPVGEGEIEAEEGREDHHRDGEGTYTNHYDRPLIVVMSIWDTDGANFKLKIGDLVYTSPYDFPQTGMFAFTFSSPS